MSTLKIVVYRRNTLFSTSYVGLATIYNIKLFESNINYRNCILAAPDWIIAMCRGSNYGSPLPSNPPTVTKGTAGYSLTSIHVQYDSKVKGVFYNIWAISSSNGTLRGQVQDGIITRLPYALHDYREIIRDSLDNL